ncbi:MAG TPA: hypothetical protein VNY83_08560, partial [Solirubrobacterales bacterium]|nr:hypothetical protein [Solirubrobacterales bacterium]
MKRDTKAGATGSTAPACGRIAPTDLLQSAPTCSPWQSAPEEQGERRPDVERTPRSFARAARRRSTHFTAAPAT